MNSREALARKRIHAALADENPECRLSDVFYDSNDRDAKGFMDDHGFDCDDLAALLLPILQEHFKTPEEEL